MPRDLELNIGSVDFESSRALEDVMNHEPLSPMPPKP